ncbi:TPA: hypothetical protein DDW35_07090, partial [Candidatus Sumerlaeota bacterium]|nr:hypothetical protein [Candidatus Sumerlaeota bacterium]
MIRYWTLFLLLFASTISGAAFGQAPTSSQALHWQQIAPSTDMKSFRSSVESVGGKILSLTPEYKVLVSLPTTLPSTHRFAGTSTAPTRATFVEAVSTGQDAAADAKHGLGAKDPTNAEQLEILKSSNAKTPDSVEPNALSVARATLQKATSTADTTTKATTSNDTLATSADNSLSTYFPPIGSQGDQGSCTCWASCYYYNTYTQAKDENLTASGGDESVICSPAFMYPVVNLVAESGGSTSAVVC